MSDGDRGPGRHEASDAEPAEPDGGEWPPGRRLAGRRSQLVLVAAGVAAVGLLPVIVAYTQLGYTGVATSEPAATTPTDDAVGALERAAFAASVDAQARSPWSDRRAVASAVATDFDQRAAGIEAGGLGQERVHAIERNASAATTWAGTDCPGGPNRQFGPCQAIDGVVVQDRGGDVHVVAIAVDVRTVVDRGEYSGTYVLEAEVGDRAG